MMHVYQYQFISRKDGRVLAEGEVRARTTGKAARKAEINEGGYTWARLVVERKQED